MEADSLVGQTLNNQYRIDRKLGGGGMGSVYKGHDLKLVRDVAIKTMHAHLAERADFQQRFEQEARALAKLEHPGIVKVYTYGQHLNILYIVMQFIPGDNLYKLLDSLRSNGKWLPLSQALQIVRQVCEAVDYVHQQGDLHRDIKPANIMMKLDSSQGNEALHPVLTDFGLAKLAEGGLETKTGTTIGTPAYMSPEQTLGKKTDARSDVYSLGVLLYELTVGRLPFPINSLTEAIRYYASETSPPPPPPRMVNSNLPEMVEKAILKALKRNPAERFVSAAKLAEALAYVEPRVPGHTVPPIATAGAEDIGMTYEASVLNQPPDPPSPPLSLPLSRLDHIVVEAPDKSRRIIELKKPTLTIGRRPDNDLNLVDSPKVGRQHARIDFDGTEYRVTDLKSRNGTFLNQVPLLPGIPETWQPGQWLYVGGYWLLLRKGGTPGEPIPPSPKTPPSMMIEPEPETVTATIEPAQVRLSPATPTTVMLTVTNRQAEGDRFALSITGSLPGEWLLNPPTQTMVAAQSSQTVQLTLQAPRSPQSEANSYFELKVQVVSQRDGTKRAEATCKVTMERFIAFTSEVRPPGRVRPKQPVIVTIHNQGNAPETFNLSWKDPGNDLHFEAGQRKLSLKPGEKGLLKFTITPQQARLVGEEVRHDFTTEVSLEGGETQSHAGVLLSKGRVPKWALVLGVMLILLVGLGIIGWLVSAPRINGIAIEPNPVIAGESAAVKVDAFGLWPDIKVNGTPAPSGEVEYPVEPAMKGEQVINVSISDFLGRVETESTAVSVVPATVTPVIPTVVAISTPTSTPGGTPNPPEPRDPPPMDTPPVAETPTVTPPVKTATSLPDTPQTSTATPTTTPPPPTNTPTATGTPTPTPTYTSTPLAPTHGLVAYYPFNGNANDESGYNHNGVVYGGGISYVEGIRGLAASFDGVDDYILIQDSPLLSGFPSLTLVACFYKESISPDNQAIVAKWFQRTLDSPTPQAQDTYILVTHNNEVGGGTNNNCCQLASSLFEAQHWTHVIFTHTELDGGKIYVNNKLSDVLDSTGTIVSSTNPVIIGADNNADQAIWRYFHGKIDEVRIYNRALSESEIGELYRSNGCTN